MDKNEIAKLKTELFQNIKLLGQQALLPSHESAIDEIIQQIEALNLISNPLHPNYLPQLCGDWQLVYASNGTVVTRRLDFISNNNWAGITIKRVWQTLTSSESQAIAATNGAKIEFPILGEYQLQAKGIWRWAIDKKQTVKVTFDSFSIQATKLFDRANWQMPQLEIPVLIFFKNEASWRTTYLDEDLRVGRGATDNLFVFRRL